MYQHAVVFWAPKTLPGSEVRGRYDSLGSVSQRMQLTGVSTNTWGIAKAKRFQAVKVGEQGMVTSRHRWLPLAACQSDGWLRVERFYFPQEARSNGVAHSPEGSGSSDHRGITPMITWCWRWTIPGCSFWADREDNQSFLKHPFLRWCFFLIKLSN